MDSSRREAIKLMAAGAAGLTIGGMGFSAKSYARIRGANDRIGIAVIGVRGQGGFHLQNWAGMAQTENILVKTICDVDENTWPERVAETAQLQGETPKTEYDMRRVFDDPEIDAVSIATPNHWHALATIWAVQAGKDVYVEKPASHNIWEGRKMVEAARKYNRIVQVGFQNRSINSVRRAIQALHDGVIGEVYMARGLCFKPRDAFPKFPDSDPPPGLHYDLWLGPAAWQPYNEGKTHYVWHWHWNTGNGDIGNQGPHQFDIARWGLGEPGHPVKVQSSGGYYAFGDICTQETANTQTAVFEYADGKILQFEVRGLYTGGEAGLGVKIGNLFYGTKGWMEIDGSKWRTFLGRENTPGPYSDGDEAETASSTAYMAAPGGGGHYRNFLAAVRSRNVADLTCDVEEGVISSDLPHLANISYRLGRALVFDGKKERFVDDKEANRMLSREYRKPYVVPDKV